MSTRLRAVLAAAALLPPVLGAAVGLRAQPQSAAEQVAPRVRGYAVPRTPWGDPDLNGIWPSIDMVRVPVQRAPQYGTRLFMTPEEHAALEKREQEQIARMAADGAGGATGAPGHWVEWESRNCRHRSSSIRQTAACRR